MKKIILILVIMILTTFSHAEKAAVLGEILKPTLMVMDDDQIYITQNASIFVYSLKDYKLKKKIGKLGQGPQELNANPLQPLIIHVEDDNIIANSAGKVTVFSKDGRFIREIRMKNATDGYFFSFKDGFLGKATDFENNVLYLTINLFDAQLNKGKEIYRIKSPIQTDGKMMMFKSQLKYYPYNDRIFIAWEDDFVIDVLDAAGKKLFTIRQEYERQKFTQSDEDAYIKSARRLYGKQFEMFKQGMVFPRYYPAIASFAVTGNKLFAVTWKRVSDKIEFFIFDWNGKLLKTLFLPFVLQDEVGGYPWAVRNGKLYQLIENQDSEEWELHVHPIGL